MRFRLRPPFEVACAAALLGAAACERPPVAPPDDAPDAAVDVTTFLQDRPAIGGKWYTYQVDGHVMEPKPEAWILRTAEGSFAGFRIVSVYDDATGDSGVFTLERVTRPTAPGAWTAPERYTASRNVKDDEPVCVDLVVGVERDCAGAGWHLRLIEQSRYSVFAGFAVAEPAIFLADDAVVARVDLDAIDGDLQALPDPATIPDLIDAPPADLTTTDWDFSRFAHDLPAAGRVLGALDLVDGQPFRMVTAKNELAVVTVARVDAATLHVDVTRAPLSREDGTLGDEVVSAADIDIGGLADAPVFLSLDAADLRTPAADLQGSAWPTKPPSSRRYDLVVVDGAAPALLLSPATAATRIVPADPG